MKQAAEFGIVKGGQSLAALLMFSADVNALLGRVLEEEGNRDLQGAGYLLQSAGA